MLTSSPVVWGPCRLAHTLALTLAAFYSPHPKWIALQAWNKPDKVTLFDSDVSFNYGTAFITKSKHKRLKKKDSKEMTLDPAAGWEMTFAY